MSPELTDLYQQVILDHNRRPRNRGRLPTANRMAHGDNPSCGDQCDVYLRMDGDRIAEISFDGAGCAISQASTSMLLESIKGKTLEEVAHLDHDIVLENVGIGISPTRMKCAMLGLKVAKSAALGEIATWPDEAGT